MTLHERVAVFAPNGAKLFVAEQSQADCLIAGGAEVYSIRRGRVSAIQLCAGQVAYGNQDILRPGSYGIVRDLQTVPGHLVYRHKDIEQEEQELAA